MRKYIEKAFTFFTVSSIVTALMFIFHYAGGEIGISAVWLEKFRLNGKPFVNLVLALLQLSLLSAAWFTVRQNAKSLDIQQKTLARQSRGIKKIESEHNINMSFGSYYWVMLRKNRGDFNWQVEHGHTTNYQNKKILHVKQPKSLAESEKQILQRKVMRRYRILGVLMLILPLNNVLINFMYIYEYTFAIDIPLPDKWLHYIQLFVDWSETLWKVPVIGIALCIVEIIIAGYVFYAYLGNPFKSMK